MEFNETPLPSQQVIKKNFVEIHNYPEKPIIEYSETGRSYTYNIIEEGNYPPVAYLKYTKRQNGFRIPDNYEVETSWGKPKKRHLVRCIIKYVDNNPIYWVCYGNNYQHQIKSEKSCSDAASLYAKALDPETKTRHSGPYVFGLQLEILQQARNAKRRAATLKPFDNLTLTGQNNRAKKIAKSVHAIFDQTAIKSCHLEDKPILKSIEFDIKDQPFHINMGEENVEDMKHKVRATVQACDRGQIARDGYRTLALVNHNLPREWRVSSERKEITCEINKLIPISLVNLTSLLSNNDYINSEVHIDDAEIIDNMQQSIGKSGRQSIIDILKYLIPNLVKREVLCMTHPEIYLQISGDGRNVGKNVKHVMITFSILNDKNKLHQTENHYTTTLYPGIEKYEILNIVLEHLIVELRKLKEEGLEDNHGVKWKINLYFSSDWKFLVICLGMNAANSKYFCPWCEVSKEQQGDFSYNWTISHIQPLLFDMIPLQSWVPDELHMMLRITDVLWRLVLDEIRSRNTWGDKARNVIIEEMERIGVKFHFRLEVGSTNWQFTSLMGQDKLTVLQHFDLNKLFPRSRAAQIRNLWNNFYLLHKAVKDSKTDVVQFSNDAREWLHQFLDSSFYQASDITPYMHVLMYHIPEMMHIHRQFGLAAFSCSAVEKKNHQQVSHFFRKTTKDGGGRKGRKSAIIDILEYENRTLYFNNCDEIDLVPKPKRLCI
ncbi:hypothetical protein RirG_078850 [Rhizophagus irregularis DAOM 197198w]|uniref:Uncharacterized protein n=1 Tax=Rhizophagus irregularis (strain DAOM 197198w) TaxID=1432141 RepID=A0A015MX65_RHIIW|nr:hypothetical protein RirG_078850 [Rhizophagus irregularis DAOM 197198w]